MPLTPTALNDLVIATTRELSKGKWTQAAQTFQRYETLSKWFKEKKVQVDSGYGISRTIQLSLAGAAKHNSFADADNPVIKDLLTQVTNNWVHAQTHWAYYYQEQLMNGTVNRIIDEIKARSEGSMIDMAEELENKTWGAAPTTTSENTLPRGVQYWIVPSSTAAVGFNGGAPSGHTTVGGINPTTNANWKNATGTFTAWTKDQFVDSACQLMYECNFESPVGREDFYSAKGQNFRIYCSYAASRQISKIGEAQNENLGKDIASMDGIVTLKSNAIIPLPVLKQYDSASTFNTSGNSPVYFINHQTFYPVVLKGDFMRESEPLRLPQQHNAYAVYRDLTYNFLCVNRRSNGVLYKSA